MTGMALHPLGSTGLEIAELCLGTSNFGDLTDAAESRRIIDTYLAAGGNSVDTADVYAGGAAEEIVGSALQGRREGVVLVTKGGMQTATAARRGGGSRAAITAAVEGSLRRLKTDWIDLFIMHVPDPDTPLEQTLAALDALVRSGKVRYIGASNYAGWQVAKALGISARQDFAAFIALQAQYSLVARDVELDLLPLCQEESLSVIAYAPLGGGILSGKYDPSKPPPAGTRLADLPANAHPLTQRSLAIVEALNQVATAVNRSPAQVALRWVRARPMVASVIVGARTAEQLQSNLGMVGWSLDDEHVRKLEKASRPRLVYPHDLQQMLGCRPNPARTG